MHGGASTKIKGRGSGEGCQTENTVGLFEEVALSEARVAPEQRECSVMADDINRRAINNVFGRFASAVGKIAAVYRME